MTLGVEVQEESHHRQGDRQGRSDERPDPRCRKSCLASRAGQERYAAARTDTTADPVTIGLGLQPSRARPRRRRRLRVR